MTSVGMFVAGFAAFAGAIIGVFLLALKAEDRSKARNRIHTLRKRAER